MGCRWRTFYSLALPVEVLGNVVQHAIGENDN